MLIAKHQVANRFQFCQRKFPVILLSSPPSHNSNLPVGLYHFDKPRSSGYRQQQVITATATPTPKVESLRAPRYHDPSCNRLKQRYHVQSEHLVPQTDVSKHGTLVSIDQQNSRLKGGVNNASGPEVSRFNSKRVRSS
jgi:hypothetical protein